MNYSKDVHFTTLLSISHDVRVLADDQFSCIGYSPGPADSGLVYQDTGLTAYAGNNPASS